MKIMNIRSIFLIATTCLGIILPTAQLYAPPASPTATAPQLSDEDLKFLEDLGKQIQDEVAKLPTRAQLKAQGLSDEEIARGEKSNKIQTKEKFDEDVKRYSEMSEEELFAEMEKALAEVEKASTPEAGPAYPPMDIYQGEEEAPKPVTPAPTPKPAVSSNKQQAALQLIDALLASITNFLSKAQVMVELPGKISSWTKEGKLRNWPATLTWNNFKMQIEELQAKLNKIKDKDPKTGTYKYLDELIKEEATYNNLVKIKDALAKSEPKIIVGSFNIDKMSSPVRQAIRDTLLSLHEAVSTLSLPASLDKIIEKYEPTAKKIKESEEAAQKRALEESKRGRTPGYTTVAGYPKAEREYRGRYDFDRDGGSYKPGLFEAPEREKARPDEKKETKPAAGGAAGGAAKPEAKKPEEKKPAEKPKREEDKTATSYVSKINESLYEFLDAIQENKHLQNIQGHMIDDSWVDSKLIEESKKALAGIRNAGRYAKRLKDQIAKLTPEQKKDYRKDMREAYKSVKEQIEKLITQINNAEKPLGSEVLKKPSIATPVKAKKFAYFGRTDKDEAALRDIVNKNKKEISDAQQKAQTEGTTADQDIIQKEIETKKIEELLGRENLVDLSDLRKEMKAMQKLASEI